MVENRFNLIDEPWIPVVDKGRVSLRDIFSNTYISALGGNPIQKISLIKLFQAIAQSAYTPPNNDYWLELGVTGLAKACLEYLDKWYDRFFLYGEKPFLQMPAIAVAKQQSFGVILPEIATGNTTIHTQIQQEKVLNDAEKALLILQISGFGLGGKKTDNSVVLTPGYLEKTNDKGKVASGKPGPLLGFYGYLHNFLLGSTICETMWLNLFTNEQIESYKIYSQKLGIAPWEKMPLGENDEVAQNLKISLMGRFIPMNRFVLLAENGLHYSEGITHFTHKEGMADPSVSVNFFAKEPKAIWCDPGRRPWRSITSLLSFLSASSNDKFECFQLRSGLCRPHSSVKIGIWSGGLRVSSNAGEQYVSGSDDFIESIIFIPADAFAGQEWFSYLQSEMIELDTIAKTLYGCVTAYYKYLTTDGKEFAKQSTNLFWQLCEHSFQKLVNYAEDKVKRYELRKEFAGFIDKAFNVYCLRNTARQLDAWAKSKPNLFKYLKVEN